MASVDEITVCNMALMRIGVGERVTSSDGTLGNRTDSTLAGDHCELLYPIARDDVSADFPWAKLTKFALLVLEDDGTGAVWESEWDNAYTYPADCLYVRKFLTAAGPGGTDEAPFALGTIADGTEVIFTDVAEADANIEYTMQIADDDPVPDVKLAQAIAAKLGKLLRQPLNVAPQLAIQDEKEYQIALSNAAKSSANEAEPSETGDGPYVDAR